MMTPKSVLEHYDSGELWPSADARAVHDDVGQAYEGAFALRRLREARGEKVVGYKIGFTNRTIWERYGISAPIWGPVYDTSVSWREEREEVVLAAASLPRLEPECTLCLKATPLPETTLDQLFDCLEWYAPSFEIVQSHLPDWNSAPRRRFWTARFITASS